MARIRTIKPEFPQSESMWRVSREARLLFIMFWTICDDAGRARGNSRMLASLLYPYDDDAPSLIDGWLEELENEKCIIRYEIEGSTYLQICNWLTHQKIDKPSESKIPQFIEGSRILSKARECSSLDLDLVPGPSTKDQGMDLVAQPLESSLRETPPVLVSAAKALKGPDPIARETWEAYASSYEARYGAKPVRNAKVNGQVAQLVKRLGDESPQVSEFYLTHNGQYYVQRMHDFGLLLSDAEKLRTEWATGSRMTATRARQTDSAQSNFDAAQQAKEMLRQKASHV